MSARRVAARTGGGVGQPAWLAWVLPLALAVMWLAMALAPQVTGGAVVVLAGLVCAAVLAVVLALQGGTVERVALRPLIAPTVAVVVLGLAAAMSANPGVAFAGLWAMRVAWVAWVLALALLGVTYVSVMRSHDPDSLVSGLVGSVAVIGGVSAAFAVAEWAGVYVPSMPGWSEKPAGVFENSQSLAQLLVVALFCSAAWLASAGSRRGRVAAGFLVVLCAAGLAASEARGAVAGVILGVVVYVALSASRRPVRRAATVLVAAAGAGYAALLAVVAVSPNAHSVLEGLDRVLTGRLTLWHSTLRAFASEPLLGRGPMNVSAYTTWGVTADSAPIGQVAFDPHSLAVYWLVSAGLAGAIAAVWAAWSLIGPMARAGARSKGAALQVAAVAAWLGATASTWLNPYSLVVVAMLSASVIARGHMPAVSGSGPGPGTLRPVPAIGVRPVAAALAALCALCALAFAPYALAEMRWTAAMQAPPAERFELAEELARQTRDPSYAVRGIVAAFELAPDDTDRAYLRRALDLAREFEGDSSWHVSLAYNDLQVHAAAHMLDEATLDELRAAITRARRADPASGYFDFIAAEALLRLGYTDLAPLYARRSLEFPQTPETRAILEDVIAGRSVGDTSAQ